MIREGSQTRQPVPEEDSGPPRAHTPSSSEQAEGNLNPFERADSIKRPKSRRIAERARSPGEHPARPKAVARPRRHAAFADQGQAPHQGPAPQEGYRLFAAALWPGPDWLSRSGRPCGAPRPRNLILRLLGTTIFTVVLVASERLASLLTQVSLFTVSTAWIRPRPVLSRVRPVVGHTQPPRVLASAGPTRSSAGF